MEDFMITRILLATDGSELSNQATFEGIALARSLNATVVGFFAPEEYQSFLSNEYLPPGLVPQNQYQQKLVESVDAALAVVARAARAAGVPYESFSIPAMTPWPAIVEAAVQKRCDLIFMASRSRNRLVRWIRGSQTTEVLSHSDIPVLVWRQHASSASQVGHH
jgi:nucleotide-binding universal stress UspA family protein